MLAQMLGIVPTRLLFDRDTAVMLLLVLSQVKPNHGLQ